MPLATRRIQTWPSAFSTCCGAGLGHLSLKPSVGHCYGQWTLNCCVTSLPPCLVMSVTMMLHVIRRNYRWSCSEAPLVDTNGCAGPWLTWTVGITQVALGYVCASFSVLYSCLATSVTTNVIVKRKKDSRKKFLIGWHMCKIFFLLCSVQNVYMLYGHNFEHH